MATNWQPPFGLPFPPPFPPPAQQPQQQAQPDGQNAPSDSYHPPSAYLPPPPPPPPPPQQPWSIPGLNLQAHGQNAQQPQFPAAWPPTFPTPDQINQWSQMQMDMQQLPFMMMQNAPPLPGLGFASNAPPQSPFQPAAASTQPFPAAPPNPFPAPFPHNGSVTPSTPHTLPMRNDRVAEVIEKDKEDGEVSEGGSKSPAVNGRAQTEHVRSVPSSSARAANSLVSRQETYNPDQPAAGQTASHSKPAARTKASVNTLSQQRGDAKAFIKLLHNNNIGYHTLAAEDLDAAALRDLYRSLNLPSAPEPVPSVSNSNGTAQASQRNETQDTARSSVVTPNNSKSITTINTNIPVTTSVPSPVPGNRAEYLKRLQAAKKGKQTGGTTATPPHKTPPPTANVPKLPPVSKSADGAITNQSLTEDEKRAKTTELIRKRIEALKNNSSSPASAVPSNPPPAVTPAAPSSLPPRPPDVINPAFGASTPQPVPASPFGNIPGLFMNASPVAPPHLVPSTPGHNNRKRPSSPGIDSTRSPQHLAPTQTKISSTVVPAGPSQTELHSTPRLPPRPELQSRPASVNPSQSGMSTPGPQTPSSTARNQELDEKARKQAALKERLQKKIEEQKRESERRLASAQNSPKSVSQPAHTLPSVGNDPEVARESKRRRKADVEAEQSAVDTEIAENAARLAQITKELELLTANDAKLRQNKEKLQAELESLGIDTEGMPHAELQARKDEIEREQHAASGTLSPADVHSTSSLPVAITNGTTPARVLPGPGNTWQQPKNSPQLTSEGIPGLNGSYPRNAASAKIPKNQIPPASQTMVQQKLDKSFKPLPAKPPVPLPARDRNADKPSTPVDDEEDFYSPEPGVSLPVSGQSGTTSAPLTRFRSPSEEGEMAMSESEEEYEPEESLNPQAGAPSIINDISEHAPTHTGSRASVSSTSASSATDEDEEMYEPPDADQPMLDLERNVEPDEPEEAQRRFAEEEEMDMSTSSDDDSDSDTSSESSEEDPNEPAPSSNSRNPDSSIIVTDNLAPELQPVRSVVEPASQDVGASSVTQNLNAEQDLANTRSFVPYESPLKHFKSYRYHPNFAQDVSSGFLSMTYSHQIDPTKELCTNEASGEPCSDANCPFQHYRDMEISGDKLLVQLGTANPGKTPEERQRWNEGLRAVLKDLRQKNSKDPNGIAVEIANFRRQFLQDDTRVVNL